MWQLIKETDMFGNTKQAKARNGPDSSFVQPWLCDSVSVVGLKISEVTRSDPCR